MNDFNSVVGFGQSVFHNTRGNTLYCPIRGTIGSTLSPKEKKIRKKKNKKQKACRKRNRK